MGNNLGPSGATLGQLNWRAARGKAPTRLTHEFALFTDASFTGKRIMRLGPYEVHRARRSRNPDAPALYLYVAYHALRDDHSSPLVHTDLKHNVRIEREISALISLRLGIRTSAREVTRYLFDGEDPYAEKDPYRIPVFSPFDSARVYSMIPHTVKPRDLVDLSFLSTLLDLGDEDARALLRAALLYSDALWLADSQPELAWLLLVSAAEAAAARWAFVTGVANSRFEDSQTGKRVRAILEMGGAAALIPQMAEALGSLTGSTHKFLNFLLRYLPPPPPGRSAATESLCRWDEKAMKKALDRVYAHRSRALHEGEPFPWPMCGTPFYHHHGLAEVPTLPTRPTQETPWKAKDCPMFLHVFEHIVRKALNAWWQDAAARAHGSSAAERPSKLAV